MTNLGPLPKEHSRSRVVREAELEFSIFVLALEQKHELTYGEMFGMYSSHMAILAKYMRRSERHPDEPDKPGDWE